MWKGLSLGLLDWLLGRQLGLEVQYPVAQYSDPHSMHNAVMPSFVGHKY